MNQPESRAPTPASGPSPESPAAGLAPQATDSNTSIDWERFYARFREPGFIAGFEIENRLGSGAFGEVYRARRTSIGKPYAIKFLKVDGDLDRAVIEREIGQARLFAALDHPNLVTVEDVGTVDGVPYLVMGYAGEDTLARRLKRGPLDVPTALALFTQICRGVLALHDRKLVHFDLKPGNVFLKGDTVRVGDYGLAKLVADGRQTLSLGRGTPLYVAPEVLMGRADQRADIYSLGIVLYECLVGRPPFSPESGLGAILRRDDSPVPYPLDFPRALLPIVERCLARDPDQRYSSVADLLADLGQAGRRGDSFVLPNRLLASPLSGPSAPGSESASAAHPSDVVEWTTLEDASMRPPSPLQGTPSGLPVHAAPWSDQGLQESAASPVAAGGWAPPGGASDWLPGAPSSALPLTWVPVPPAVAGGRIPTARVILRVGLDLLGVVVGNPLRILGSALAARFWPATKKAGSVTRSLVLWALWLVGMTLLGVLVVSLLVILASG
jgi:serine/threonine protein kinase